MESLQYNYSQKIWRPCPTAADGDCFFHSVFGIREANDQLYRDRLANFRRMYWATFLTYYNSSRNVTSALLKLLKRCFKANDKYQHQRIETPCNHMDYIKDVALSDYWVMVEEIPLLAALENIRIVLFIDNRETPYIFEPNAEDYLGEFPFRSINPIREVVICLVNNHFSRLNPHVEFTTNKTNSPMNKTIIQQPQISTKEAKTNYYFNRKKNFEKLGNAGIEGGLYQVHLLTMVLLNGLLKVRDWRISTENKKAGKLDDLVFEYLPLKSAILLQAKHKENETKHKITYNDLMSIDKKSDFSLVKYFVSYQQVKSQFKVQNVVICTNVVFDERTTKDILKMESVSPKDVLYFEGSDNICYSFTGSSFPDFKQNILVYCNKYEKGKAVPMDKTNIDDFFSHFRIFTNCLGDCVLDKVIEETVSKVTLSANLDNKSIYNDIHKRMVDWFKERKGRYLTQIEARAFFCDIKSNKYCESLNKYDISFKEHKVPLIIQKLRGKEISHDNHPPQNDQTRIEHIIPEKEYMLNVVKIYQAIQALPPEYKDKSLFVNPDEPIEVRKQIIDAFVVQHYTILVIVCHKQDEPKKVIDICDTLMEILNYYKYKHVILIAGESNKLAMQIKIANGKYYKALIDNIKFTDLRRETQEKFKRKKNINFQGSTMSLEELFESWASDDLDQIVNSEIVEKLSTNEEINVGLELQNLDNYYIHRSFKRDGRSIPEEDICRSEGIINEKVILISDTAGMGKSTVLISLAISIKKYYPYLWIVRIDLNSYTNIMNATLTQGATSISVEQLLDSQKTSKLRNEFERKLFRTRQRIVLMLDAVDEVSPKYTKLVKNLVKDSLNQVRFVKIFVTSRPHLCEEFEKFLNVKSFTLEPFSEEDQIAFLKKYWTEQLNLRCSLQMSRCESYAKGLIRKKSIWVDRRYQNKIAGIPLQTRMIAEVFLDKKLIGSADSENWEGCKEFMLSKNDQPIVPDKINLIQLYEMFIDRKREIFIREKSNPSGGTAADEALEEKFEQCRAYHRSLALRVIFPQDKCDLFACHKSIEWPIPKSIERNLVRIGVVQGNEMDFIHRTFAEFFVSDGIIIELQHADENEAFKKFLMDDILCSSRFYVIRAFLDSLLQKKSLPLENIFIYSPRYMNAIRKYINVFAKEDCAIILSLLIKYIGQHTGGYVLYESIYAMTVKNATFPYKIPFVTAATYGHLNVVKLLWEMSAGKYTSESLDEATVEFADKLSVDGSKDDTIKKKYLTSSKALLEASDRGHLEVVKFLVDECNADVNTKDKMGCTALIKAASKCDLDIVKFLANDCNADVNIRDNWGGTALYTAACTGELEVVKFLANECNADVNVKDNKGSTALYESAWRGYFDIVKFLVDECNVDVNIKDNGGRTALYTAACMGKLEVIKFLADKCNADPNIKNNDGRTALHEAATMDKLDVVKLLVDECNADVNIKDNEEKTAFYNASFMGNLDIIKFLAHECNADVNIKDDMGCTALNKAACKCDLDIVKCLANECNADVNVRDNCGGTALYAAASKGELEVVKFLVNECNADVNIQDNGGRTALYTAVCMGKLKIIKFLVEKCNADVNIKNNEGRTALHEAASMGKLEVVKLLVDECNADVNIKNNEGKMALSEAVFMGSLDIVKFLADKCNPNVAYKR